MKRFLIALTRTANGLISCCLWCYIRQSVALGWDESIPKTHAQHSGGLLVEAFVSSGCDDVVHGADALHVVLEKLPDAN